MIVNIEQVITRTKSRLRLMETTENDSYISKLIEESARGLSATNTYTIQCYRSEIDCQKAALPDNYDELVFFQLNPDGCSGCCNCNAESDTTIIPPPPVICSCPSYYFYDKAAVISGCGWYSNYFYIQGGYIHFPSTITSTEVRIFYRGFNTDEDGFMLIDEEMERCLSAYAAYQYASSYPESYTPQQVAGWAAEYRAQKGWLNGKKVIREFKLQKDYISLICNAVLINKRVGGVSGV